MPIAATDKKGLKRICLSCSTRFYDFNKRPIACPNCGIEFTGDVKIRTRRSRAANDGADGQVTRNQAEEGETELIKDLDDEAEESETVSLESLEEEEDGDDVPEDEEELDADLDLDEDLETDIDEEDSDDDDEDEDDEDEEDEEDDE